MLDIEKLVNVPRDLGKITKDPSGFPNRTDSSISFVDGTRTFSITPTGASFDYYITGVRYNVSSADSIIIPDTEGIWFIYYDGATLTATLNPSHSAILDIIVNKAWVADVFWDSDNSKGQLMEERHGVNMSSSTHLYAHETMGTRFNSGLALNTISVDQNGSADSHAQFGVDAGHIFDEDIEHILNTIGSTVGLQIWYRDTSGWAFTTNSGFSMLTTGTGRLAYDNNGTLTEVNNGDFVLCHIFGTNFVENNPIATIGQTEYATKKAAQEGALTEIINILSVANVSPELKPLASVIFQTKNTYTNSVKAIIVSTDEGDDYVDFRTDSLNPAFSSAQEHGNLAGLMDDDHTQYYGSGLREPDHVDLSNIGTNTHAQIDTHLALSSVHFTEGSIDHGSIAGLSDDDHTQYQKETDFTAGSVLFRGASVITEDNAKLFWDDTNNRLGIGTETPQLNVHVKGVSDTRVLVESTVGNSILQSIAGSSGDSFLSLGVSGGQNWCVGIDNDDDDKFIISNTFGMGNPVLIITKDPEHRVAISATVPLAKLHVDQKLTTAAVPVLYLDQADISEEMIEFNTTIGIGNAIEAVGAKSLTTTHFIKVTLPGSLTRYIPCGTIA